MKPRDMAIITGIIWLLVLLLALAVLFGAAEAKAADPWSKTDLAMAGTMLALKAVDAGQTRYIAQNPDRFYELNPILGRHPSETDVALFFIGSTAIDLAIAHFLPSKWRKVWLGLEIVQEVYWTSHNQRIGLKVAW